jgi:hypothetical protein
MITANYVNADDNAHKAAANAYFRNREMAGTYTLAQQCLAQRALDVLDTAFAYARSFVNYRKKFIAVKLEKQMARDKHVAREALAILESKGYTVVKTPQGLVVRIPR